MSSIRFANVHKSFDDRPVLREVFFRLSSGDRVGLIGKNGAGKTTVLRLILGQEEADEGQVEVDAGLKIGYFSQFSELSGEKSVEQVLDELFEAVHALEYALLEVEESLEAAPAEPGLTGLLHRHDESTDQEKKPRIGPKAERARADDS